jgi:hypothetical protein
MQHRFTVHPKLQLKYDFTRTWQSRAPAFAYQTAIDYETDYCIAPGCGSTGKRKDLLTKGEYFR